MAEAKTEPAPEDVVKKATPKRRRSRRSVSHGQIHVLATFNNTIITVTDNKGNVLTSASAGASGFRGSKKGTAYAAQVAAERAITEAKQNFGVSKADVYVKGIGMGRESAIRTLINQKVEVDSVKDVTASPHGGTRPRKAKRN
jgi:small subunit ribosomal protein S11